MWIPLIPCDSAHLDMCQQFEQNTMIIMAHGAWWSGVPPCFLVGICPKLEAVVHSVYGRSMQRLSGVYSRGGRRGVYIKHPLWKRASSVRQSGARAGRFSMLPAHRRSSSQRGEQPGDLERV